MHVMSHFLHHINLIVVILNGYKSNEMQWFYMYFTVIYLITLIVLIKTTHLNVRTFVYAFALLVF